jgi:hypothetical protein
LIGVAGASTTAPKSAVQSILSKTDTYLTNIRTFFLCSSTKCKNERSALLKSAQNSMNSLSAQATMASKASVQHKYHSAVALFVTDVGLLRASYQQYFTTTSTDTLSGMVGNVFYLTSQVGSDVNVIRAEEQNAKVSFKLWVEGEAATLVAMQTDAGALQSSSATTAIGIFANQLLEEASNEMLRHANGPNASFNTMLKNFAHNQLRISQSEILFLQGKKAPMTETQVANLNVTLSAEFSKIIKTETTLVKQK